MRFGSLPRITPVRGSTVPPPLTSVATLAGFGAALALVSAVALFAAGPAFAQGSEASPGNRGAAPAAAQGRAADRAPRGASAAPAAPVTAVRLAANVYLLAGGGGANSTALVGPDGALLVDAKIDMASGEGVAAALRGVGADRVRFLVNTHEHPDHTGANALFGEQGAVIIAHEGVREVLAAGQRGGPPAPAEALPVATFGDGDVVTLHLDGETAEIRHMPPAHTATNALVRYVNADVYHLGDLYTRVRYPVIAGGTLQGFIDSTDRVLAMSDASAKFVPGVGEVGDRADLIAYRKMLVTVRDRVAALVKQGKSLDEVTAAKPTAEFDETYGQPGPLFLPVIYKELGGGK
ncbi:MAG TPA: MBL fold metallo-hydrolase [Gammaproteobacteria bacterium]|nr:MBL fold metallo-hydrolase [Gammaproteobacteria bacterium]